MAEDSQVNIALKVTADNAGVAKVEQGLGRVGTAAKKTADEAKGGFAQMQQGVGRVTGAIGALRNIITGFGIVGLFMPIVSVFKSWNDEIKRTEERAKALRDELSLKAAAEEVKALAANYRDLGDAIKATSEQRARENELFSEEVRIRREAEDVASEAAEADALADVDPNAADADEQREQIRARFSAARQRTAADRKREDVIFRRQALGQQASDANQAADRLEATLAGDDKALLKARTRASTLYALSVERNEKDGTWYNSRKRTEEGDAERDRLRKEADAAQKEVERLEAEKAAKEKEIANLRASASHAGKLSDVLFKAIGTAETARETVNVNEDAALEAKDAAKAAEAAKIADAQAAHRALSAQRASLIGQIDAQRGSKFAANYAVYQAQGDYDLAAANGSRGARALPAAQQALTEAQNAALNVNHAADSAINALKETLNSVEARLKAAQSYLERQSKQTQNFMSETPSGA